MESVASGADQLNGAVAWVATASLILGIAGIVVSLVFRLSPLVIAVVLVSLLVLVIAEGNYRVWRETVTEKQDVVTKRDVAKCAREFPVP